MKTFIILLLIAVSGGFINLVHAQSSASAGSNSQSGAQAGAGAIAITNIGGGASRTTTDPRTGITTQTTDGATSPFASGGDSAGGIGVGIGGSSSANNQGNKQAITFNSTAVKQSKNTPGLVMPGLTTTLSDTCMGSISTGAVGAGFGGSFGKTYTDEECVRRLHSRFLANAGQGEIAMQIMCGSPMVAEATARLARATGNKDTCMVGDPVKPKKASNEYAGKTLYDSQEDDFLFD